MKRFITNKYVIYTLGILLFLLLWEIISLIINEPIIIFPDPITTIIEAGKLLINKETYVHIGASLYRVLVGFIIAFILALIFGSLAGNNKYIYKLFLPTITALKAIPTAAMVFVFLVLVGFNDAPILIVILMAFPILYDSVVGGFINIDKTINDALKLDTSNEVKKALFVRLPLSIPYILVGLASSFALTFKVEIMAEIMTGTNGNGLGTIIRLQRTVLNPSDMRPVFAYSLIVVILVLLSHLLASIAKKKLLS